MGDANIVALSASAGANFSTLGNETASARVAGTDHSYEYRLNDALLYNKGHAVFTVTLGGLMFETCLSGQEYEFKPYNKNNKTGSSRSLRSGGSFRKDSKSEQAEEKRETDVFANAQREVSAQIGNLQNFAKSLSKKWKKEDTATATAADSDGDKTQDKTPDNKTPIDAAVEYKTAAMPASTSSFSISEEDNEADTTDTDFVHL